MALRRLTQLRTLEVALAKAGFGPVVGVDEAGRGACAGPLTVAACALPQRTFPELARLTDSKRLTPALRERLYPHILESAEAFAIVHLWPREIDTRGVQRANIAGMRLAVSRLGIRPGYVLTDAWRVPGLTCPQLPIIGGDATSRCIAAASVLAKVSRDRLMVELDEQYPGYGFAGHKGYNTKAHLAAVRRQGASPVHRYTYANVAAAHREWQRET